MVDELKPGFEGGNGGDFTPPPTTFDDGESFDDHEAGRTYTEVDMTYLTRLGSSALALRMEVEKRPAPKDPTLN
jgi:hypothetical protein